MINPKRGNRVHDTEFNWAFKPGSSQNNATISLREFQQNSNTLINNNQLFQRHPTFAKIITAKIVKILQDTMSQHISVA